MLRIGLLINPWAGVGGSVALKGSDGVREQALQLGAEMRAVERTRRAFERLQDVAADVSIECWGGEMGAAALDGLGLPFRICGQPRGAISDAADTREAARSLAALKPDVLVFTGGDGTARDVLDAVGDSQAVLGIPSGVKMHSGVYAVSPEAAGDLLARLSRGGLVNVSLREVRDIDEEAFRHGEVRAQYYGELLTPEEGHYLQHTKVSGIENAELAAQDIAAGFVESMRDDTLYLFGPGSTTAAILVELGLEGTLLGVDAVANGDLLCTDASERDLLALLDARPGPARIVITAIGGQGHILGRGNQQISPAVLRRVGLDNIDVVASKGKIASLQGRPLLVDSNDPEIDRALSGYRRVLTGYHDEILYPVGELP